MMRCMLDSGAFSAWSLGKSIDLDAYCAYIEHNQEWISHYIALDVINQNDPNAAAEASYANLLTMRKRGLNPLPVLHVGEDFSRLERMLDLGCDYICLSATSITSRGNVDAWYRDAWTYLVDRKGLPVVKVHALGETRYSILSRFPWASVDSTRWLYAPQRTGVLILPGGKLFSVRNDGVSSRSAESIHDLSEANHVDFEAAVRQYGLDPSLLKIRGPLATVLRTYLAVVHFKDMETRVRALHPINFKYARGFHSSVSTKPSIDIGSFNLFFVVNTAWWSVTIPAFARVTNYLASFFYIENGCFRYLPEYTRDPVECIMQNEKAAALWKQLEDHIKP